MRLYAFSIDGRKNAVLSPCTARVALSSLGRVLQTTVTLRRDTTFVMIKLVYRTILFINNTSLSVAAGFLNTVIAMFTDLERVRGLDRESERGV